jgi:hypothetical protein
VLFLDKVKVKIEVTSITMNSVGCAKSPCEARQFGTACGAILRTLSASRLGLQNGIAGRQWPNRMK